MTDSNAATVTPSRKSSEKHRVSPLYRGVFAVLAPCVVIATYGLPLWAVTWTHAVLPPPLAWVWIVLAPLIYAVLFVLVAGLLSLPFQRFIVAGRFPRDTAHPVYCGRRLYGLCWTTVYYCKPVYAICLSLPWLKALAFRLFGYRGSLDFTIYPDSWIRDLPLLDLGAGTYVANRATLGTNISMLNGEILVRPIRIGKNSMIGHLTMVACGTTIGNDVMIDCGVAVGISVEIESEAVVLAASSVCHYAHLERGATAGYQSYVGQGSRLGPGVKLPALRATPARSRAPTQSAMERLLASEGHVTCIPKPVDPPAQKGAHADA